MTHHCNDFSWSIRLYFALALTFFSLLSLSEGRAQTIQRQSIGICGANMVSEGILVKQTIGQPYATATYYANGIGFRPGFQQPTVSLSRVSFIEEGLHQANNRLIVYPNPATSSVSIKSEKGITNGLLSVMDSNGRLVLNHQVSELNNHLINCESWDNGLYLISVSTEGRTSYSAKLIISK